MSADEKSCMPFHLQVLAIDCEMVGVGPGGEQSALAR